jgi:hypothetical protein
VRNSANANVEKEDVGSSGSDELEPTGGSSDHRPVRSPNAVQADVRIRAAFPTRAGF